jgi:hypothetical protein
VTPGKRREPLVQDDGGLRRRDGFLLAYHQGAVVGGRRPVHPAHGIARAVFAGHDVIVAGVGAGTGCCDAVVPAGSREARHRKLDGGGRHGQRVAVVNGPPVQGQPERIRELGCYRSDQVLSAFAGAQMVFVPAGPALG